MLDEDCNFIFAVKGNNPYFPKDIEIKKLNDKMPYTAESALQHGKLYKEYTKEELLKILY